MKNKVWLITVIMITIVMSGCSNKESAKNLELKEISNPVEDNIAKPVEIESDAGIFENYENPADISDIDSYTIASSDGHFIEFAVNTPISSIKHNAIEVIGQSADETKPITNQDTVNIGYFLHDEADANYTLVSVKSIGDKNAEATGVDLDTRNIDNVTLYPSRLEDFYIFDKLFDNRVSTFLANVGNPNYNCKTKVVDPYAEDKNGEKKEKEVTAYVYEGNGYYLMVFSFDGETIDRISFTNEQLENRD